MSIFSRFLWCLFPYDSMLWRYCCFASHYTGLLSSLIPWTPPVLVSHIIAFHYLGTARDPLTSALLAAVFSHVASLFQIPFSATSFHGLAPFFLTLVLSLILLILVTAFHSFVTSIPFLFFLFHCFPFLASIPFSFFYFHRIPFFFLLLFHSLVGLISFLCYFHSFIFILFICYFHSFLCSISYLRYFHSFLFFPFHSLVASIPFLCYSLVPAS